MKEFVKPQGICFNFNKLRASDLSRIVCKIINFLKNIESNVNLKLYDDWWEHDGLHFYRGLINFDELYKMTNSSESLLKSTPEDFEVRVGISTAENDWYLRYRVDWDDAETNLIGNCSIILPINLVEKFKSEILQDIDILTEEIDAQLFYDEILD